MWSRTYEHSCGSGLFLVNEDLNTCFFLLLDLQIVIFLTHLILVKYFVLYIGNFYKCFLKIVLPFGGHNKIS